MSTLPNGTITFLFTDIEGSTRLWQDHPDEMKDSMARHNSILRLAIESCDGYIFQVIGDAFCAAFQQASHAINAATKAQTELSNEAWNGAVIKVRMGIHTGEADLQGNGEYQGYLSLCRVARLMSAGHGGQTLISASTRALVQDRLPNHVTLADLGERRLKDLTWPEHIYQLDIAGLPTDFPPLKTLEKYRHNLPAQTTSFIGREKETEEIKGSLDEHRLVTLTGSGGTGKTRLSLQVAVDLLDQFPDGVWFVELASVTDPDLIPQAILSAAEVQIEPGRSTIDGLKDFLRNKTCLVILDNCEHLIDACAKLAELLLSTASGLKILASSREAIAARGEQAWHVPSLSTPDLKHLPPIEQLSQYEAVGLFIDRARLAQPHFRLTDENAPAVAEICSRLDGIPLALELAASRVKVLMVEQIATRLDDRFRLLTGGSRTALPRQQTLRATIDWSYELLSEQEKRLLRRLAVFMGGWTLDLAEQVCSDVELDALEILDVLSKLVDKSLVTMYEGSNKARYRMLETVRQYVREKLFESGEGERVRDRHLQAFIALAEKAEPEIRGANQLNWLDRLDDEVDNLRGALEWAQGRDPECFLQLASALWRFWHLHGYDADLEWLPAAIAATAGTPTVRRARAMARASFVALNNSDISGARKWAKEAEDLCRATGDKPGLMIALDVLSNLETDPERALALLDQALELISEIGSHWEMSGNLNSRGSLLLGKNDLKTARRFFEQALKEARLAGDKRRICYGLETLVYISLAEGDTSQTENFCQETLAEAKSIRDYNHIFGSQWTLALAKLFQDDYAGTREILGEIFKLTSMEKSWTSQTIMLGAWIELAEGNIASAIEHLEKGLSLARQTTDQLAITNQLYWLGDALRRNGDFTLAREKYTEAMGIYQKEHLSFGFCICLEGFGMLALDQKQAEKGACLLAARERLRTSEYLVDYLPFMVRERERHIATAREQLGEQAFHQAWEAGKAMSTNNALKYASEQVSG